MKVEYHYSESTVKPDTIEIYGHSVFLRKDIYEEKRTQEDGSLVSFWVYQEAILNFDEFSKFTPMLLISGLQDESSNQLTIMEAIADLYELITSKK